LRIIIYFIVKLNPLKVYDAMWYGAFGSSRRFWVTVRDSMMMLVSVSVSHRFPDCASGTSARKARSWWGGIATAACMIYFGGSMPTWLMLIVMAGASVVARRNLGFIPGLFKAIWGDQ
jgi:simple sugar transport system permease protein